MWQKRPFKSSFSDSVKALEADIQHANSMEVKNVQRRPFKSSFSESIKAPEADIQHANSIAAALPRDDCGDRIQMRLSYSPFAQVFLFLMDWMDYSCTDTIPTHLGLLNVLVNKVCLDGMPRMSSKEAKASLREFYAVIYPLLKQLKGEFARIGGINRATPERIEGKGEFCNRELERDDECGICMESHANTVLPDCGHSMCISCYNNWNARSGSCPFCRGSLSGVTSADLWILMSKIDVVDAFTLAMENLSSFYLYIESLMCNNTGTTYPSRLHDLTLRRACFDFCRPYK